MAVGGARSGGGGGASSPTSAYTIAKNGGKHAGLITKAANQTTQQLQKSLNSLNKQIDTHLDKISNPSKYYKDWKTMSKGWKENVIKNWKKEVKGFKEETKIIKEVIKRRK